MSQPQFSPVPQTTATPSQGLPTAEAPLNATGPDAITTAPATGAPSTAPAIISVPGTEASPASEPLTFNDKLNAGDRYWKFKVALQAILIITGLIGIGCIAWTLSTGPRYGYSYGYDSSFYLWPSLITFAISIIWCAICISVFISRKKTVHPGTRVAMDLLLWLGFIVTVLFVIATLVELMSWGGYGSLTGYGYYSSDGEYELASNGTWIWDQDDRYISSPRSCNGSTGSSSYYYSNHNTFKDCAEQDAYINKLWQEKPHRVNVELTGTVCQFFGLILHFALFVWACIDTHRYNRSKINRDAEKIAAGIVQTMISNGAIIPPPGQVYMRPPMGQGMYYQIPAQQAYPMATLYPQRMPDQHPQMAPGVYHAASPAGPGPATGSNGEKGERPRYA